MKKMMKNLLMMALAVFVGKAFAADTAVYTVTEDGGSWSSSELSINSDIEINFGDTENKIVTLQDILKGVSPIKSLTVTGTKGGNIVSEGITIDSTHIKAHVVVDSYTDQFGAITIYPDASLKLVSGSSGNKNYNVTGITPEEGQARPKLIISNTIDANGWGMKDDGTIANVDLEVVGEKRFYIRTTKIGEGVALIVSTTGSAWVGMEGTEVTLIGLSGDGKFYAGCHWNNNTGAVTINLPDGVEKTFNGVFDEKSKGSLTVSGNGTLTLAGENTATGLLKVEAGATLNLTKKWNGKVEVNGTIKGSATIAGVLQLNNTATANLDVSEGSITANEVWVMGGASNSAKVTLPQPYAVGTPIVSCSTKVDTVAGDLSGKMPDGYCCVVDSDGKTIKLAKKPVAKIGETSYTTLEEAFAAAQAGDTITLLADISSSAIIVLDKAITLDGNGKTLTSTAGRAINVSGANGVTIKNLTIDAKGERAINIIQGATNVTIENVTATAANYTVNVASSAPDAVVAIKNSTLNGLCTVNVSAAGAQVTVDNSIVNCNDNNTTAGESYAALSLNKEAVGGTIAVTGTTINVAEGSDSVEARNGAENGTITIDGSTAQVNTVVAYITYLNSPAYHAFYTLQSAIDFAKADDTITLLRDVTLTSKLTLGKAVTIDGNGHSIVANHTAFILETSSDCEFKNITLNTNNKAKGVKIASGNVTFDNVTIPNSNKSDAITVAGALTIKNYFKAEGSYYSTIDARNGVVTVAEGTIFDMDKFSGNVFPAKCDLKAAVDTNGNPYFCAYGSTTYYKNFSSVATTITDLTLLDNVELNSNLSVKGELDLNGKTLTLAEGKVLKTGGNLTIINEATFVGPIELTSASYTVTAPDGLNVITKVTGKKVVYENGVYKLADIVYAAKIGEQKYETLQAALNAAVAGAGSVTVEILSNIDMTGNTWTPVAVDSDSFVTVNGNNKTITGLNDMLFASTWAGTSGLVINDLTIADSTIIHDENDSAGNIGVGAFVGYPQASATVTLNNCHLKDSTVKGGHWTGGLVGIAGGYNGTDGPVFMTLTIDGCSVTGSTITGKGSAGGIIGHGSCSAWTDVIIVNSTVSNNTITSTGSSDNKAGSVMGTIGAAGQPTTVNGVTKTGGMSVSVTTAGNTVTSADKVITTIYGRQGTETGLLEIAGGTYESYPIEENVEYAAPKDGYIIFENADGKYGVKEGAYVAEINGVKYETLAAALSAAQDGATVELLWAEGNAPIAMNGSVFGKSVTITGTATVDWSKGFLFVGRGGEGNGTVIFDNANLASASNNASTGIHVSGREKNTNNKYDGTVVINNSTIVLDYLIDKGSMTMTNSTLTVKNGFAVGGRPASETESGADATATFDLTNGSKLIVNNHNGMGLGYEAIGVMTIDSTSTFECTQSFLVTDKGVLKSAGNVFGDIVKSDNAQIELTGGIYTDEEVPGWCAEPYAALPNLNDQYVVGVKPTATVNNLGAMTIPENEYYIYNGSLTTGTEPMPLNFVMQFVADQKGEDMATSPFAQWYADFVITFEGIEGDSFDATGCYLAGYYGSTDSWDGLWVKIPVDGLLEKIEKGVRYPVMLGVNMAQTYDYICSGVQAFSCAMFIPEDILKANPNLKVKLELNVVDSSEGEGAAYDALVNGENIFNASETEYTVEDFIVGLAGSGTEEDPFLIKDLDDLIFFRDSVNNGETKYNAAGVYVALDADIDMASVDWSVNIGDAADTSFDGIFDGKGKKILNLNSVETAKDPWGYICTGLFGCIAGNAQIKNLTLENVNITAEFTGNNVAALVGFAYNCSGAIDNVTVKNVAINAANATGVGAIVGYDYYSPALKVTNCTVDGTSINGAAYVGGVIGYASTKIELNNNTVKNLTLNGTASVGGVAGIMLAGGSASGNTVEKVQLSATGAMWANSIGLVAGTITTGSVTVAGTTATDCAVTDIVGGILVEKPTSPIEKVQAKIGDKYFTTLELALNAAQSSETVTLVADVALSKFLKLEKSLTLELGAYTITRNGGSGVLYVNNADANVTINATTGGVTGPQAVWVNAGTVTINGGTFTGVGGEAVYTAGNGNVVINGGTFSSNVDGFVINQKDGDRSTSSIVINGGTFVGFDPRNNAAETAGTTFMAAGKYTFAEGGNYIVVTPEDYILNGVSSDSATVNEIDSLLAGAVTVTKDGEKYVATATYTFRVTAVDTVKPEKSSYELTGGKLRPGKTVAVKYIDLATGTESWDKPEADTVTFKLVIK